MKIPRNRNQIPMNTNAKEQTMNLGPVTISASSIHAKSPQYAAMWRVSNDGVSMILKSTRLAGGQAIDFDNSALDSGDLFLVVSASPIPRDVIRRLLCFATTEDAFLSGDFRAKLFRLKR